MFSVITMSRDGPKYEEGGLALEEAGKKHYEWVAESFREAGVEEFELNSEVIDRLVELEATPFNNDSRAIRTVSLEMARHLAESRPELALSEGELKNLSLACLLHDVGKSGPADASLEARKTIQELYTLGRKSGGRGELKVPPGTPVGKVIREMWPGEAEARLEHLKGAGKASIETMRDFWDAHGYWSCEILERYPKGLNDRVLDIVASHHILEGVNPKKLRDAPVESLLIDAGESYVEFMLIVADKYEAAIVRGGKSHKEAVEFIREKVTNSEFKNNESARIVLSALDEVGERALRRFAGETSRE